MVSAPQAFHPSRPGSLMQRRVFWSIFIILSLIADFALPMLSALLATLPIVVLSWWVAYRSGWF